MLTMTFVISTERRIAPASEILKPRARRSLAMSSDGILPRTIFSSRKVICLDARNFRCRRFGLDIAVRLFPVIGHRLHLAKEYPMRSSFSVQISLLHHKVGQIDVFDRIRAENLIRPDIDLVFQLQLPSGVHRASDDLLVSSEMTASRSCGTLPFAFSCIIVPESSSWTEIFRNLFAP